MKRIPLNNDCFFCHSQSGLEIHEIFFGTAKRKLSIKHGLMVYLCYNCHRGTYGVHHNREKDLILKRYGQRHFEKEYTREDFVKTFGRNYDK